MKIDHQRVYFFCVCSFDFRKKKTLVIRSLIVR